MGKSSIGLAVLGICTGAAFAATLPYQGLATDAKGNPRADGAATATFSLYPALSGGASTWTESQAISTKKGLFSVVLGSVATIPDSLFDGRALWLGVALDGGAEASPRLALGAVPFAVGAKSSASARRAAVADSAGRSHLADSARRVGGMDSLARMVERLQATVALLKAGDSARIARDSSLIAAQARTIAGLTTLLRGVSRVGTSLYFDSMNVSVRNGSGRTDAANGLGNLVIGYNEMRGGSDDQRTGSHMLVTGLRQNYSGYGGIMGGVFNSVTGNFSSILGGRWSVATGNLSSILGGTDNHADGMHSCVSGGSGNVASGEGSSVSGGVSNTAYQTHSSILGGASNTAGTKSGGELSTVLGGKFNITSVDYSSLP